MNSQINDKPLVSIITPFLNPGRFFQECIESVLAQTYNNWELLLINDGSTDGSAPLAKEYAAKYPARIHYLEHDNNENLGASASRNLGIQKSQGVLIAFLDSDDIYLPSKLEEQVPILNSQPTAGMLYSATEYWYSWTGLPQDLKKDWVWNTFGVQPDNLIMPPKLLTTFLKDGATVPCMGSVLVRREAIDFVKGWENVFKYVYEDQVFHAKICMNWPVFVASGCWDRYRQHPDSTCHTIERTNQENTVRSVYLNWLGNYLIEQGVEKKSELWKAFNTAMRPFKYKRLNKLFLLKNRIVRKLKNRGRKFFRKNKPSTGFK